MGWDVLNKGMGGSLENGGISPEELQLRPLFSEKVRFLGISGLKWVNLTQMTIISKTVGRNPLEEME